MFKFRIRLIFTALFTILFAGLCYFFFLWQILKDYLQLEAIGILRNIIFILGLVIIVALFAGMLLSFLFSAKFSRSICELNKAVQAISRRDFHYRIKSGGLGEIGELISNFNRMSAQLYNFELKAKIRNKDLERIIKEKNKELNYIYKIGREISSTLDLDKVLDTIIKRTTEVLTLQRCTLLLADEVSGEALRVVRCEGIDLDKIRPQTLSKGEGISGWVWEKAEAILIKAIERDLRFRQRKKERYLKGCLLSVPLKVEGKIIGIINANNKVNGELFTDEDLFLLQEISVESAIAIENALLYNSLKQVYVHTISALAKALEAKEGYASTHSDNVTKYAIAIAEEKGLSVSQIEVIRQACLLHDLGKIGVHDYILTKTDKLTPAEWDEIKTHTIRGAQILQPISFLKEVAGLIRQHHEKFNGQGYPLNISGDDIKLGARIMAVADAFDAMISHRPYRKALTLPEAIAELKANSGTQFDPQIVRIFLKVLKNRPDLIKLA